MKFVKVALIGILAASLIISSMSIYSAYGSGTLVIEMMDPPAGWGPAEGVEIHYSAIMIHRANASEESGWRTIVQDGWISLLSVVNVSEVIGESALSAGKYNLIRFNITGANVTVNGIEYEAIVINGHLNIPIIRGGIQVRAGETTYLIIDITPRITGSPTQGFRLVPAAKAIPA